MTQHTIRVRRRPVLPRFSEPRFTLAPGRAKWDRLNISVDLGGCGASTSKDVYNLFRRVASVFCWLRCEGTEEYPKLTTAQSQNDRLYHVEVFYRKPSSKRAGLLRANFTFNPTRHYAHCPEIDPARYKNPLFVILKNQSATIKLEQLSAGHQDNWICDDDLSSSNQVDWDRYAYTLLKICAGDIMEKITLHAGAVPVNPYPEHLMSWTVRSAELYWEYYHQHARSALAEFYSKAKNTFSASQDATHVMSSTPSGNSYTFITKRHELELCAYAKTETRIRLECRFKKYPRKIFPRELSRSNYPDSSLGDLPDFLGAMRDCSGVIDTQVLAAIRAYTAGDGSSEAVIDLLSNFMALGSCAERERKQIIRSLVLGGRISEGYSPTVMQALEQLSAAGLLLRYRKKANRPRAYGAAPDLQTMLDRLTIPQR